MDESLLLPDGHYSAAGTADIESLTDMVEKLLRAAWGSDWGLFTDESPTGNNPEDTPLPHITYNLVSRVATKDRTLKWQQFDSFPDPEHKGHNVTLYRQWFDCEMEFVLHAKTRREATRLSQRFEEFMETYKGYFKQQGISEIIFKEESSPVVSSEYRQDIPTRALYYQVRVERITAVRSVHLRRVEQIINVETDKNALTENETPKTEYGETTVASEESSDFLDIYNNHFPK